MVKQWNIFRVFPPKVMRFLNSNQLWPVLNCTLGLSSVLVGAFSTNLSRLFFLPSSSSRARARLVLSASLARVPCLPRARAVILPFLFFLVEIGG